MNVISSLVIIALTGIWSVKHLAVVLSYGPKSNNIYHLSSTFFESRPYLVVKESCETIICRKVVLLFDEFF